VSTPKPSTVQDIQVNAAATVLAECGHYALQQAWGMPAVNWHSASPIWKQTLIEHAAYFLERLKPIVKRPHLAMVKAPAPSSANSGDDPGEGEKRCLPSRGETSAAFLIDPEPCLYCGCAIEAEGFGLYCSALCERVDQ